MADNIGPPPPFPPSYPWSQPPPPPVGDAQWTYPQAFPPSPFVCPSTWTNQPNYPQPVANTPPWPYPGQPPPPPNMPFPPAVPPPTVPPQMINTMPPSFPPMVAAPPPLPSYSVPPLPPPVANPPLPNEPCPPPPDSEDTSSTSRFPDSGPGTKSDSHSLRDPMKNISIKVEPHDEKDHMKTQSSKRNVGQESYESKPSKKETKVKNNDKLRGSSKVFQEKPDSHSRLKNHDSKKSRGSSPSHSRSHYKSSDDHKEYAKNLRDHSNKYKREKSGKEHCNDQRNRSTSSPSPDRVKRHFSRRSVYADYNPEGDHRRSSHQSSKRSSSHKVPVHTVSSKSKESDKKSHKSPKKSSSSHVHKKKRHRGSSLEDERRDSRKRTKSAEKISKKSRSSKSTDSLVKKQTTPSEKSLHKHHSNKSEDEAIAEKTSVGTDQVGHGPEADKVSVPTSSLEEKGKDKKSSSKFKSPEAKLKVYDDIWRKVRGKPRAHLKLNKKTVVSSTGTEVEKKRSLDASKDEHPDSSAEVQSPVKVSSKKREEKDSKNDKKGGKDPIRSTRDRKDRLSIKISSKFSRSSLSRSRETRRSSPKISSSRRDRLRKYKRSRSWERVEKEDQPQLTTEPSKWLMSTPADNYYSIVEDSKEVVATDALIKLHDKFHYELVDRAERVRASRPKYEPPQRKIKLRNHKPVVLHNEDKSSSGCSSEESTSEDEDTAMEELEKKRQHPYRLHPELWFNDPNEMNDGPLCRCSAKARRSGIRHGIYIGEEHLPPCKPHSNNAKRLYHYKICMTPVTNFLTKSPTIILHNGEKYIFEGFSMFSHKPLPKLPHCKVIRFNYEYTIMYIEEKMPTNFTVAGLELFSKFLLGEILELVDLDWRAHNDVDGCPRFHFMPRFAKAGKDKGKELLSLSAILEYLLAANKPLIEESKLSEVLALSDKKWQNLADKVKGMIVTCPGMKPSSVRIDQLDREHTDSSLDKTFPVIVHFGIRPPQLSYAGNPLYQKAWRDYVKYRHLLANKPKVLTSDRHKLTQKEVKLQEMRMENDLKRDVTIVISGKGFYQTGLMSDMVQHAMMLPILVCHLRFHASLDKLEEKVGYKFQDRFLLQLSLTHPSYRENFGTNPDHARNSLTNCGLRQPQYGDRRIHYLNTRKRGINTLINIMSRFGNDKESESCIKYNERLEFLGDAVVEFLSSIHLFYMFPDLEEGGLATYRAAIVQNQHLAVLSKKLNLETFMLYAHGSDLCHDLELKHAMANCFEALMGALFLDAGIEVADKVFTKTLFPEPELQEVWKNYPLHPLQEQEPNGDRQWIESIPLLQKLQTFEEQIGIEFTHIRLLARALTHRSLGYNNLTLGSNQRLEFLGDTVLQLVASEYLYKFFPQHHEGHLSLLRSSLVNNRTQAVVCGDLGMVDYAIYPEYKLDLKPKDKADLLEAFLGALYVDKDLGYCRKFCEVCFFPRLQDFIMNQDWNDPKSKLQQCCLTLRSMDGGEPDIPTYKVIECKGPTNTRVYEVAVYFQGNRLAVGDGHSIQLAEMDAAANALKKSKDLFPQLRHQKRAIERSLKQGSKSNREDMKRQSPGRRRIKEETKERKSRSPKR